MRTNLAFGALIVCLAALYPGPSPGAGATDLPTLRQTAHDGDAAAQYELGDRYYRGRDLEQSYAEALRWYRRAAERGHMMAQYLVGVMFANGEGVSQDYVEGYAWMSLVARQGDSHAAELKEQYRARMNPAQLDRAREKAAALQERLLR